MDGRIINAWHDGQFAYLAVVIKEAGVDTEYIGSLPLTVTKGMNEKQERAALVTAVRALWESLHAGAALPHKGAVTL